MNIIITKNIKVKEDMEAMDKKSPFTAPLKVLTTNKEINEYVLSFMSKEVGPPKSLNVDPFYCDLVDNRTIDVEESMRDIFQGCREIGHKISTVNLFGPEPQLNIMKGHLMSKIVSRTYSDKPAHLKLCKNAAIVLM